jgi:6-phosphogluconate dehydrogenase
MGQNLVLNMNDHGYKVAVSIAPSPRWMISSRTKLPARRWWARTRWRSLFSSQTSAARHADGEGGRHRRSHDRGILPHLEKGDIIIDGGNSHWPDTNRRTKYLAEKGILFIGTGVSGGEEGARHGPSIMPGGNPAAWPHVKEIFQAIAAKVEDGTPCCDWVGEDGAGHYVKMVHNGIEYGDMQLICEAYQLMKDGWASAPTNCTKCSPIGTKGELDSYLIDITSQIFAKKDEDGTPIVDKILDTAGQKGTGKWTCLERA